MKMLVLMAVTALVASCAGAFAAARPPRITEAGLTGRTDVIVFSDFESENWWRDWGERRQPRNTELVGGETALAGRGKCLRVTVEAGSHYGTSVTYRFKNMIGTEPEEMYLRYYVKFDTNWKHATSGGKMPGFGGTYGRAGWGGRPVHGSDGWSARGGYGNPRGRDKTADGFYCYHADMRGRYGNSWHFSPALDHGKWHCVEKYCKLNTPAEAGGAGGGKGKNDGILRGWINGRQVWEKTDIRFRDTDKLKMETVWLNIYHGGATPVPPQDIHVYFDNVVIARKYVGPAVFERPKAKSTGPVVIAPKITADEAKAAATEKEAGRLFQMARQAEMMGHRALAKTMYKQVVEKFPGTEAAKKAEEKVK